MNIYFSVSTSMSSGQTSYLQMHKMLYLIIEVKLESGLLKGYSSQ